VRVPNSLSLWEQFATFDNFLLAWQRLANVSSRMVIDELGREVFAYNLHENIEDLVARVSNEDNLYQPLPDSKVYVPKPSTTLRTMSMMCIPDLIVYQAMVNVIADNSYRYLVTHENQHVWGNLYAGHASPYMLKPWKTQYRNFVDRIVKLFQDGNNWIASTDIVSFYDTIDHRTLLGFVKKYAGNDVRFITLLENCLANWASHSTDTVMSRGIPQGSNASDYLANLYLYEIDQQMILKGHQYVRYVDDVRIMGSNKAIVQQGLIDFDLALKKYGLVAQVNKTSVHQIGDIKQEITILKFWVTDPADLMTTYVDEVKLPNSEQASSIRDFVTSSSRDTLDDAIESDDTNDDEEADDSDNPTADDNTSTEAIQNQLYEQFLDAFANLDDPEKGKEANIKITYCLNRLFRRDDLKEKVLQLLDKIPWRSEAITRYLALFEKDEVVICGLTEFIQNHQVYYWHRANALEALAKIAGANYVTPICRDWLSDDLQTWYPKVIATRLLMKAPRQHSFLVECLRREQNKNDLKERAILRQQLAFAAFTTSKSRQKHSTLFDIILKQAESTLLRRLSIYLLQQAACNLTWDDLQVHHSTLGEYGDLIEKLGISLDVPRPCYVLQSVVHLFSVNVAVSDFRNYYGLHYDRASKHLRKAVEYYYSSNNDFVRNFYQFAHLTLIAFHQYVLPGRSDPTSMDYSDLWKHSDFRARTLLGNSTWEKLGNLRNRVDHPIDRSTRLHSETIKNKEADFLKKQLSVALQELYQEWIAAPPPPP